MSHNIIEFLGNVLKSALRTEYEKPRVGWYYPSLLPSCLRRQFLIYKRGLTISEEKAGIFRLGELIHSYLAGVLRQSDLAVKASEAQFIIVILMDGEFIRISGRADMLIELNNEIYVVEVKSIKRLPQEPLKHHVMQLQAYLAAFGAKGLLVYLEKNALQHKIFQVDFNNEEFRRLVDRAKRLHEALVKDAEPGGDAETWECLFCEFKNECP
ncbi:MAG: CRISPR-associated protein Cas4 [Candidatus Bathyarchaeia archaeon]